jgi:hypothetical protein
VRRQQDDAPEVGGPRTQRLRLQIHFQVNVVASIRRLAQIDHSPVRRIEDAPDLGNGRVHRNAQIFRDLDVRSRNVERLIGLGDFNSRQGGKGGITTSRRNRSGARAKTRSSI